jgi:hypothetical protein
MKAYGADKAESIAAVFEFNGARYIICIDTVKYEDDGISDNLAVIFPYSLASIVIMQE